MFIHFHKKSFQQTGQTVIHQHSPTSNLKRVKLDPKNITKSHLSQIKKTFWVYALGRTPVALLNTTINGVLLAAILQTKIIDKLFNHFKQKPDRADKNAAVCCDSAADNGEENTLTSAADNATSATTDGAVVADNSSENTQSSTDFKSQNSGIHSTKG